MPWDEGLQGQALQIAATPNSPLCVVAGPGTGKTFALMRRLTRLLEVGQSCSRSNSRLHLYPNRGGRHHAVHLATGCYWCRNGSHPDCPRLLLLDVVSPGRARGHRPRAPATTAVRGAVSTSGPRKDRAWRRSCLRQEAPGLLSGMGSSSARHPWLAARRFRSGVPVYAIGVYHPNQADACRLVRNWTAQCLRFQDACPCEVNHRRNHADRCFPIHSRAGVTVSGRGDRAAVRRVDEWETVKRRPPLNDAVAFALARIVDDAQTDRRDPSHSDLQFCVVRWTLTPGDPNSQGQTVGKAKRVRSVLTWAIEHSYENGCGFVDQLVPWIFDYYTKLDFSPAHKIHKIHALRMVSASSALSSCFCYRGLVSLVRTCGGFRDESPNYVGEEAIKGLRDAMASEGFVLASDGDLRPAALDTLSGTALTDALASYVRRAQRGADDAALMVGAGKDLLEAVAAHVLYECFGISNPPHNFPTALGQAFVALDLKTSADRPANGEPPQYRLQRALYDAACAVNTLRNKQGTGHGRPWLPSVTAEEARHATQVMGVVGDLLLRAMREKLGQ